MRSLLIGLMLLAGSASASAALIKGSVGWGGEFDRVGDTFSFSNVEVDYATGDLATAGIGDGDVLTLNSFNTSAFASGVHWILNGFTYELNSLNVVFDNFGATVILGGGTMSHADFDPTHFQFDFASNRGGNFAASAVPEPGSLVLLGCGLIGLIQLRRRIA